jgi:hypothetical protein
VTGQGGFSVRIRKWGRSTKKIHKVDLNGSRALNAYGDSATRIPANTDRTGGDAANRYGSGCQPTERYCTGGNNAKTHSSSGNKTSCDWARRNKAGGHITYCNDSSRMTKMFTAFLIRPVRNRDKRDAE